MLFRQIFRLTSFLVLLTTYAIGASLIRAVCHGEFSTRRYLARWVKCHCRLALAAFGVKIDSNLSDLSAEDLNTLIVSNHLGYLDVMVIASQVPTSFVTSVDMRETFFVGWITEIAGCLYVDRRNKSNIKNEIGMLKDALREGLNVCVFPEATSTSGESVLRFRRPLYNAAVLSERPVTPLCVNYLAVNGEPISSRNRDFLFWYGDMPFFSHLWNFWSITSANVNLRFSPSLDSQVADISFAVHGYDPATVLAERSHQIVSGQFCSVM